MSEQRFSTEEVLPQITVGADGVLRGTVHMDIDSVETPAPEQLATYVPELVEWFDDERTGEKVAAITVSQLRYFAILRQGAPSGIILDDVDGSRVASRLLGEQDRLTKLGLGEYVTHGGASTNGLNAAKLPDLVSRLQADVDDPRWLQIRGVGPKSIQFLAEYCAAMLPKP